MGVGDGSHDLLTRVEALERRLERLEAERAVERVMYWYVHGCDVLKDADYIASHFTEDGIWEGRGNFAEFGQTVGREGIRKMFVDNPTLLPFTAHFLTNPVVVVSQDGASAWGTWLTLEAATLRDRIAQVWIAAIYDNDFERVGLDWKIKHLRYRDIFVVPYEEGWLKTRYVSPLTFRKVTEL